MEGDEEIIAVFLEESRENLDQADLDLVALESAPGNTDLVARLFRTIHTIKGTSGFLGFERLQAVTNAGESLLAELRSGALAPTPSITTSLLQLLDAIRASLARIEATGAEGEEDFAEVIAELDRRRHGGAAAQPSPAEPARVTSPAPAEGPTSPPPSDGSVRISVAVLDNLMELVSELVSVGSQLAVEADPLGYDGQSEARRKLKLVTAGLQQQVMHARLQPIGVVTGRFRRDARDLALSLGKQVRVEIAGEDVGVDRAVNEQLRDPLLHLVRNALDHGLEPPDERVAAGKDPTGTLRIQASHSHGRVQIEITDDGRGIDSAALVKRAVEQRLIPAERAAVLTPQDALDLIFIPGLTTSREVTNVSGRGVGMDVVRANIEQCGGSIDVESTAGVGTSIQLNMPLTLAIMPVLCVNSAGSRFAIPQANVQEVRRLDATDLDGAPEDIHGALVYRLRDHLLSAVSLAQVLRLDPAGSEKLLVVLESEAKRFALLVSGVGDCDDIVVKPLTRETRSIQAFGGATIYGDGQPVLILDIAGVAKLAGIERRAPELPPVSLPSPGRRAGALLLASAPDGGRLAVPLESVQRLERFGPGDVERMGALDVVQYRDEILPLIQVHTLLPERRSQPRGQVRSPAERGLDTVVCDCSHGPVGLVVSRIDSIVSRPDHPSQPGTRRGVLECEIVSGRVVEVLDIEALAADSRIPEHFAGGGSK